MIVQDMPEAEYHARPELSSTEARLLLDSPAKYRWKKDNPPLVAPSKKFDVGSAVHAKVLGVGYEVAVIPDEVLASNGAASTSAARAFIADAREQGLVPLKQADMAPIVGMAEAVLAHPTARALLSQPGASEVSVFGTDPVTGVECRTRFDFLPDPSETRLVAVDLKTTVDASKRGFENSAARYEYPVQRAWYLDALSWVADVRDPEMLFVVVEKEPPYLVGVYQVPSVWAEKGHTAAAHARNLFKTCTESGVWPGLPEQVVLLDEPTWHVFEFEEKFQ